MRYLLYLIMVIETACSVAQPVNGVQDKFQPAMAYTHLTLVKGNGQKIMNATVLVKDGKIVQCGANIAIPSGYQVQDWSGYWVYPSFIELYSSYGLPEKKNEIPLTGPRHWNPAIHPEHHAADEMVYDDQMASTLRQSGFGMVLTHRNDGIARGYGSLMCLSPEKLHKNLLDPELSAFFSFRKGKSKEAYPSSLMGSIALLRQSIYDAKGYVPAVGQETHLSNIHLKKQLVIPGIFDAGNVLDVLRADQISKEFGLNWIYKGGGDEYQYADALKKAGIRVILPLTFPAAYEIKNSADILHVRLQDMQHWEMAPANAFIMKQAGIPFCLSHHGLKNDVEFKKALKKIKSYGLSDQDILEALTVRPAEFMGRKDIGNLEAGMLANFFITDGDFFSDETTMMGHCIQGYYIPHADHTLPDPRGKFLWQSTTNPADSVVFEVKGSRGSPKITWKYPENSGRVQMESKSLPFRVITQSAVYEWFISPSLNMRKMQISGKDILYRGVYTPLEPAKTDSTTNSIPSSYKFALPYQYFSVDSSTLIKDVTVWTSESDGKLVGYDVLFEKGKITAIAEEIPAKPGWKIIRGNGMHLTPGIIDEHSHIAISHGVNEGTQSVTSEVRISDVVNPQDINIYRQLAGGVTTSHLLHGSANSIGGQTALIKLRYGQTAEGLKSGYPQSFIKFALGENVKQSNWGDQNTSRYPQTRMGVEQVIEDAFLRAKAYKKTIGTPEFKRDLELDALCEILDQKKFITCHSYQQGEINMLLHLADSLGFKVNTFTHILEGYKVADKLKAHGAAASTFADWWAYKYEVIEAIPYNAAILNDEGVLTGINSDDAEMGRRLNQEAAKAIKYGGMSETDALKMITINPAKMLHIDGQTGSIKVGKDADLVLWNNYPLSVYAMPLTTWVDGKIYFDIEMDKLMQKTVEQEKIRIWKAMHEAAKKGEPVKAPIEKKEKLYHCDDLEVYED